MGRSVVSTMISLKLYLSLLLVLSLLLSPLAQYSISFQRTDNTLALMCNDNGGRINLLSNTNVEFFVNRTVGDRTGSANLSEILLGMARELERDRTSGDVAFFEITPELEGHYSCGVGTQDNSPIQRFVTLRRTDLRAITNQRTEYAVRSNDGSVTLLCPSEPGSLQGCYFGSWKKDSITIVNTVRQPGKGTCEPAAVFDTTNSKYQLDRETFSLTITPVEASDSGTYSCELRVLDPASPVGSSVLVFIPRNISLTVDGEPSIVSGPEDVVVGAQDSGSLTSSAEFTCKAIGRPAPVITWFYKIISETGDLESEEILNLDSHKVLNISFPENYTEESGRIVVTCRLTFSIVDHDGGVIRCRTGSDHKDARLTVLGKPTILTTVTARGGPVIIDIMLPAHIQHPVRLHFLYSNKTHTFERRAFQPNEPYNDTRLITLREGREKLPVECSTTCSINVSLIARAGFVFVQGLSSNKATIDDDENVCKNIEEQVETNTQQLMACMQGNSNCEHQKENNKIIAIVIGVALGAIVVVVILVVIGTAMVSHICYRQFVHRKKSEPNTDSEDMIELREQNAELQKQTKDLRQELKNTKFRSEADYIIMKATSEKKLYSNNPEIQELLEDFIERANKMIEIVCTGTESVDSGSNQVGSHMINGNDDRVQHLKQVMGKFNRELESIL